MSQHTANDGKKPTIKWKDLVYDVSFFCPDMLTYIEQEIIRQALDRKNKLKISQVEKDKYSKELYIAIDTGGFSPGGDRWEAMMQSRWGGILVLWSCIYDNHRDFDLNIAGNMVASDAEDVKVALSMVLPDFFRVRGMMENLPPEKIEETVKKVQKEYGVVQK